MIMDKATKEHVETLVAMPFREFAAKMGLRFSVVPIRDS